MSGLWRNDPATKGGKYLVQRRDGTVPEWPYFVLGARDPAAPVALRAYAEEAKRLGFDHQYVGDVYDLADEFESYCLEHGKGDPTGAPHRKDDSAVVTKMKAGA